VTPFVLAAGGSKALWFATRGAGIVALLLLTATVVLGVAGAVRLRSDRLPRFVVAGLHRNLTLLALAVLCVHIGTAVADTYAPLGVKDVFIPFVSVYRPLWLGLGTLAFDLLLALTITSLLRVRIGFRRWKQLHWLAYASWPVALVHGLGTGSDARFGWIQAVAAVCALAVMAAVFLRLGPPASWRWREAALGGLALLVTLAGAVWYVGGPGSPGWAARAGTPATLLASNASARRTTSVPTSTLPPAPFQVQFTGRLKQSSRAGQLLIDISGTTAGGAPGRLWVRLEGTPWPNEYVGTVVGLQGTHLALSLNGSGRRMLVRVDLSINQTSGAVTGIVKASGGRGLNS
jgi:methionine sulfoxide reductase heme-binding subunit